MSCQQKLGCRYAISQNVFPADHEFPRPQICHSFRMADVAFLSSNNRDSNNERVDSVEIYKGLPVSMYWTLAFIESYLIRLMVA